MACRYAPSRGQKHNDRLLGGCRGILQCDGFAIHKKRAGPKPGKDVVALVLCWSHVRRGFYDLARTGAASIATEALACIAALYRVEADDDGVGRAIRPVKLSRMPCSPVAARAGQTGRTSRP